MMRMRFARRSALLGLGLGLALGCASPPPGEVGWENPGEPQADLERDREACRRLAMDAKFSHAGRDRAEAAYRGNLFLQCMNDRGWRQVLLEED
jgi:hypothetical protein